jgi:hypothetical protein
MQFCVASSQTSRRTLYFPRAIVGWVGGASRTGGDSLSYLLLHEPLGMTVSLGDWVDHVLLVMKSGTLYVVWNYKIVTGYCVQRRWDILEIGRKEGRKERGKDD